MSKRNLTPYWQGVMKRREKARRLKDKKNRMEAWFRMTPRERALERAMNRTIKRMLERIYPLQPLPESNGKTVQWRKFEPFEGGIGE